MDAKTLHTRGNGDSGAIPVAVETNINEGSTPGPFELPGLECARLAIDVPCSCQQCAVFIIKSLPRQLLRQASVSGHDPYQPSNDQGIECGKERGVAVKVIPEASTSWGSQLDLATDPLPEEDVLELDCGEDKDDASDLLISVDEEKDDIFVTVARAAQPAAPVTSRSGDESGTLASPLPSPGHAQRMYTRCCPTCHPLACCCSRIHQILLQGEETALA